MYSGLVDHSYLGSQFYYLNCLGSGFGVTKRGGNKQDSADNSTLCSLKPPNSATYVENTWNGCYTVVARANDAIASVKTFENPMSEDELGFNDVAGNAYFIRAFTYFNLVRFWGEIPLRLVPVTKETIHLAKSSVDDVYAQIISDLEMAAELMSESPRVGYPKKYAANMLLAKVYMTLAGNDNASAYWQMAYDEAIKVYGNYTLVSDYASLFNELAGQANSTESIFEIQSSVGASFDHVRAFTPSWYTKASTFGWFKVNAEVYDLHNATYPGDQRISATYISTWVQQNNQNTFSSYPSVSRSNFAKGFPFLVKLGSKNIENDIREGNQNAIVFRYSDLLLMLAEISNELQNGDQLGYVNEVLSRAGLFPHAGYSGDQAAFREAIMMEYQFELLMEGQDWFTNRRRGYDWFLNHVILPHNNYVDFKSNIGITLETDEATVMLVPFPASEINANQEISE